jgi:hypothetical protein
LGFGWDTSLEAKNNLTGDLDDLRIYSRALSPNEIDALYALKDSAATVAGDAARDANADEPEAAAPAKGTGAAAEIDTRFTQFERMLREGKFAPAGAYMTGEADKTDAEDLGAVLRAAAGVADFLVARQKLLRASFSALKGQTVKIALKKGTREGEVTGTSETGLTMRSKYMINGQTKMRAPAPIKWRELAPKEIKKRIGAWEKKQSRAVVAEALMALAVGDTETATDKLDGIENPLAEALRGRAERLSK